MDIKKLRSQLNMTQVDLAKHLDVSTQTIRMWEWGVSTPSVHNMKKLEELENALPN